MGVCPKQFVAFLSLEHSLLLRNGTNEEGSYSHDQGCSCRNTCRGNRVEEGAVREDPQRTCWRCCHRSQEDWRLRDPWIGTPQAQDKASKEDCQSLPSCCFEAVYLRFER